MSNGQDKSGPEQTGEREVGRDPSVKEARPTNVNINIRYVDKHFQVTFRHEVTRIFHNMNEILIAIQVEAEKLLP